MLEFTSVSVSSYEAATLSDALNAHAADGWSVVQIVPAGTVIVAYLSRPATGAPSDAATTATAATAAVAATAAATPVVDAPAPAPAPAPAAEPMAAAAPAAAPAPAPADAVPAGWYPDPSSRFELRYWDGTRWTEHVSRGGQQSTDPPVA
jgi:hypothetical protein